MKQATIGIVRKLLRGLSFATRLGDISQRVALRPNMKMDTVTAPRRDEKRSAMRSLLGDATTP